MKTDVLIIGGGLTAYTAANEIIAGSALRVTMLSCGGGASPFIHGFSIPVEENDSQELLYADTMASGYGQSDPALVAALCRGSLELQDYFTSFGLELDRGEDGGYRLIKSLGSSVARIAGIGNAMGPSMLRALKQTLAKNSRFEKLEGIRALDLIKDGSRVVGARCFDLEKGCFMDVRAGVVILATGGFGRLFPESTNSSDIGGDGCAMAYRAGAALTDMEFVQFEPSAALWPEAVAGKGIVTTMFYEGAVLRGNRGERFMLDHGPEAECVPKDVMSKCIYRQILDRGGSPHGGVWFDATAVPEEKWQTSYEPYLNRYLTHGIDLRKEPVEIAPAAHTTCGGVRIDEKCRTGVPGLLACGEVSGGLHGANRLGGNAGLETLVFGRIAGKTAVVEFAAVEEVAAEAVPGVAGEADYSFMHRKMQSAIRSGLNVIRSKESMTDSLEVIEGLLAELGDHDGCCDAFRLYNDLQTARLTLLSALGRKSSVGCHCREDSVEENSKYRILVQLEENQDRIKYISI